MHENILRTLFTVLVILTFFSSAWFRRKASRTGDHLDRKKEGIVILISRFVVGGLLLTYLVVMTIHPQWVFWSLFEFPLWVRYLGAAFALLVSPMVLWMFVSLGKNITDTVDTRKQHKLVTTGIYHYIRHPLYTLGSLFYISLGLLTGSWIFFLLSILSFVVIGVLRTRREEEELEKKFGQEYVDYRNRTGKYFPKIFQ